MKLAVLSCSCQKQLCRLSPGPWWIDAYRRAQESPLPARQQLSLLSLLRLLKMKSYCRLSYPSILLLRAKHQSQTGGSYWKARPAEQAAVHSSLLQSHRGPPPQYSLYGREAKEPESIKNAKEPGSFPGVQHRRYSTGCRGPCFWAWDNVGKVSPTLSLFVVSLVYHQCSVAGLKLFGIRDYSKEVGKIVFLQNNAKLKDFLIQFKKKRHLTRISPFLPHKLSF